MTSKSGARPIVSRLLTVAEVADALNVSTKTVRRLIHARDLVSIRIGRQVRVSEEDLATYVRHNRS